MNGRNKSKSFLIIVVVLGILGLIASYQFVYNKYKAKAETLASSNNVLEERVKTLKVYYDNRETYTTSIKQMLTDAEVKLADFPADVKLEDGIMQAVYMQSASDIKYNSISIGDKVDIITVPQEKVNEIKSETFTNEIVIEARTVNYSNVITYGELKAAISEIFNRNQRIAIDNITYSRTSSIGEPELNGRIDLIFYDVLGTNKEYKYPEMNEYEVGTNNIFKNVTEEDLAEAAALAEQEVTGIH